MLFVNTNVSALSGMNALATVTDRLNRSFEQLSSGSRINSAKDDAAGLQIGNRLDTQIIGTNQATRNIQDGISALQIADGAMGEITNIAQRIRQLAVQMSSNTLSQEDRDGAQMEVERLIESANKIASSASLGGDTPLLRGPDVDEEPDSPLSEKDILLQLNGALEQSEANIKAYFGIEGDGKDEFTVKFGGSAVAAVTSIGSDVQELLINKANFTSGVAMLGGTVGNDRVVMHEMVHAVMFNQFSSSVMGTGWFVEGSAELIHGADERIKTEAVGFMKAGGGDDYSRGFVSMRMLHDRMKEEGYADGVRTFMQELSDGQTTLDQAFKKLLGISETEFTDWVAATGDGYIASRMDLNNSDTGAIGGLDADGMGIKNTADAVGDSKSYSEQPLEGFRIDWSAVNFTPPHKKIFQLHTGSNAGERSDFSIRGGTAERIGLAGVNVSANARGSIAIVDKALKNIHEIRREIGGTLAELESMQRNNVSMVVNVSDSKSRITDTDFAAATAELTRNQIIQQASSTILAQANQRPNIALSLLR